MSHRYRYIKVEIKIEEASKYYPRKGGGKKAGGTGKNRVRETDNYKW